ncbi:hypothetical protein GCM10023143_24090 [Compostibacter hankyongensis]|uniref:Aspartyl protease n=1 Tax=Compostibacter hankyongensis TaxID=1007089 RepID=A0ABP8FYK3_9BACT
MLYKSKSLFKLNLQFAKYQNDLSEKDRLFYRSILDNAFNRCIQSNQDIAALRKTYEDLLPDSTAKELFNIEADNFIKLYQYKAAAMCYTKLAAKYKTPADSAALADIENSKALWGAISDVPPQEITVLKTTTVTWKKDKIGLLQIPVVHHEDSCFLVFDTGANLSVITKTAARKLGMRIYPVKLDLASGTTGQLVQSSLAVADSLYLGGMLIKNAVFLLLPDEMLYFKHGDYSQEGIIGEPVMAQLKEINIHQDGRLEIPLHPSKSHFQNLALDGLMPIADFTVQKDSLPFRFDTGAGSSVLYHPYFDRYRKEVVQNGAPYKLKTNGVGGTITESDAYTIRNFSIGIANHSTTLSKINVRTGPVGAEKDVFYGNLGLDAIGQFNTLTINFESMFIDVH